MILTENSGWLYQKTQDLIGSKSLYNWFLNNFAYISNTDDILDIGCGAGGVLKVLNSFNSYTGIEPNYYYYLKAKKLFGHKFIFQNCGVENFQNTENRKFTKILLLGVIHHLNESQIQALIVLSQQYLAEDGAIYSIDPYRRENASLFERTLINVDNGEYILDEKGHLDRLSGFTVMNYQLKSGLLNVPYSHIAIKFK